MPTIRPRKLLLDAVALAALLSSAIVACSSDDDGSSRPSGGFGYPAQTTPCEALSSCCQEDPSLSAPSIQSECKMYVSNGVQDQCSSALNLLHQQGHCGGITAGSGGSKGEGGTTATGKGGTTMGIAGSGAAPGKTMGAGGSVDLDGGTTGNPSDSGQGATTSSSGTVYCGSASDTECECGPMPSSGTASGRCDASSVPGPSLCCAAPGWPNVAPSLLLGCVCSKVSCIEAGTKDYCSCGFSQTLDVGDQFTDSCSGTVCCRSKSLLAPICYCFQSSGASCADTGDEPVSSCDVSAVECGDSTPVPGCHLRRDRQRAVAARLNSRTPRRRSRPSSLG